MNQCSSPVFRPSTPPPPQRYQAGKVNNNDDGVFIQPPSTPTSFAQFPPSSSPLRKESSLLSLNNPLYSKIISGDWSKTLLVGRGKQCDIGLPSHLNCISRVHAEIIPPSTDMAFRLKVRGVNGIKVNGYLHWKDEEIMLEDGVVLDFVGMRFVFKDGRGGRDNVENIGLATAAAVDSLMPSSSPVLRASQLGDKVIEEESIFTDKLLLQQKQGAAGSHKRSESYFASASEDEINNVSISRVRKRIRFEHINDVQQLLLPSSPPLPPLDALELDASSISLPVSMHNSNVSDGEISIGEVSPRISNNNNNIPVPEDKENVIQLINRSKESRPKKTTTATIHSNNKTNKIRNNDEISELIGDDDDDNEEEGSHSIDQQYSYSSPTQPLDIPANTSLVELIIECMVFSSRTSLTVSEIIHSLRNSHQHLFANPHTTETCQLWTGHILYTLRNSPCFGHVARRVKDASNRKVEDQWHYDPSNDLDASRRETYQGVVRTARRCTLQDKQYYFSLNHLLNFLVIVEHKDRIHQNSPSNSSSSSSGSSVKKQARIRQVAAPLSSSPPTNQI